MNIDGDELEYIEGLGLPEKELFKKHYTMVSDVLRQYLEKAYYIPTLDRTTGEIVHIQPQPEPGDPPERFNWDAPILVSPHSPTRLYYASQRVWRSDDRGDSCREVSGDLTAARIEVQQDPVNQVVEVRGVVQASEEANQLGPGVQLWFLNKYQVEVDPTKPARSPDTPPPSATTAESLIRSRVPSAERKAVARPWASSSYNCRILHLGTRGDH